MTAMLQKRNRVPDNFRALGREPRINGEHRMNKTEAEYALMLDAEYKKGNIIYWAFEEVKFRLADNTFYTPDFMVLRHDGAVEFHEVKGAHVEEDARVKFKVARDSLPFRFVWAQKLKGGAWNVEVVA
jgi:hypothetical protein